MIERRVQVNRITKETDIKLYVDLDGEGRSDIKTDIGFFNHMLNLFSFHSGINIKLEANGDIDVCDHHLIEDIGICLGESLKKALGDKVGIRRYSTFFIPMDETLAMVSIDISGRPYLHFEGEFNRETIGSFSLEMVKEFFRAVTFTAGITLHVRVIYGENDHHKVEAIFKAFGRALGEAIEIQGQELPSSKGVL